VLDLAFLLYDLKCGTWSDVAVDTLGAAAPLLPSAGIKAVTAGITSVGKTVLGKFPDYIVMAKELGARYFNIPVPIWNKMTKNEQWDANKKFLDRTIVRGDEIILSSPAKQITAATGTFRRELDYLLKNGYRLNDDGTRLLK
jgi:hypothetical protein